MPTCLSIASTQGRLHNLLLTLMVSTCLNHTQSRLLRKATHLQNAHRADGQGLALLGLLRCTQSVLCGDDLNQAGNGPERFSDVFSRQRS